MVEKTSWKYNKCFVFDIILQAFFTNFELFLAMSGQYAFAVVKTFLISSRPRRWLRDFAVLVIFVSNSSNLLWFLRCWDVFLQKSSSGIVPDFLKKNGKTWKKNVYKATFWVTFRQYFQIFLKYVVLGSITENFRSKFKKKNKVSEEKTLQFCLEP